MSGINRKSVYLKFRRIDNLNKVTFGIFPGKREFFSQISDIKCSYKNNLRSIESPIVLILIRIIDSKVYAMNTCD